MPRRLIHRNNAERQAAYRKRRKVPVYFRSKSDEWKTPLELLKVLDAEFQFVIDVAVLPYNAKCQQFFTPHQDGLKQLWQGSCWMNPPYGAALRDWVRKARDSAQNGATVVSLLLVRTLTLPLEGALPLRPTILPISKKQHRLHLACLAIWLILL